MQADNGLSYLIAAVAVLWFLWLLSLVFRDLFAWLTGAGHAPVDDGDSWSILVAAAIARTTAPDDGGQGDYARAHADRRILAKEVRRLRSVIEDMQRREDRQWNETED